MIIKSSKGISVPDELLLLLKESTLILLGDVNRGIAIPPKESLASYMSIVFEDDKNE